MEQIPKVRGIAKLENGFLESDYYYQNSSIVQEKDTIKVVPQTTKYTFKTDIKIPKLGILFVGIGGNNGTTVTAGIIANREKLSWETKKGTFTPNFYGSLTQSTTTKIGVNGSEEIFAPLKDILPLADPSQVVVSGWDISGLNMYESLRRAKVVDYDLQQKLKPFMETMKPMPGIYYPDFIAGNQAERSDNIIAGTDKWMHAMQIKKDIQQFKQDNKLDKVIVLWTGNTERFCDVQKDIHGSAKNLLDSIKSSHKEISPSTIYAVGTIMAGCSFINGSPQNSLVPGVIELAEQANVFVVGDDFKSGQTKFKTMFTDFLVSAGIKPKSIVSYNHLGNNDGLNLSSEKQFRSKEISKSSCVDDILASNEILFPRDSKTNEKDIHIDHCVVIKYVPHTGDTKKALDEYHSEIFLGGSHIFECYNVCEDSLLAAPLILDLVILTELFERIQWKTESMEEFQRFHAVLSTLGYLCKAPIRRDGAPQVNSLTRQRNGIENIFKACAGLPTDDNTLLEYRCSASLK